MNTHLVVFASVLVAELGDKTQIATLLFAANPANRRLGVPRSRGGARRIGRAGGARRRSQRPLDRSDVLRIAAGLGFVAIGVWVLLA